MCRPFLFARLRGLSVSRLYMPHTEENIYVGAVVVCDELLAVGGAEPRRYVVEP